MRRRDFLSIIPFALEMTAVRRGLSLPARTTSIIDHGARPDGKTLSTDAIQRAIDTVFQAGGGIVHVPAGTFLTGRIELKSGVTLNLLTGSTLLGSTSIEDYSPASASGPGGSSGGKHLIFAHDAVDLAITGSGTINGQGPSFWEPSGQAPLAPDQRWAGVASHELAPIRSGRPSPMLDFVNCRRLKIGSVQLQDSPGWTLRLLHCDGAEIDGISIRNPRNGPNTDGIDIVSSQNIRVSNCSVDTGDDAICLKTHRFGGEGPGVVKNIEVANCKLTTCCNGFKIGTETEGGFENISFSDSVVENAEVSYERRVISGVALEMVDGGWADGIVVSGITMRRARTPLFIRLENRRPAQDNSRHGLRNVRIENIQATEALLASSITGLPGLEVQAVTLNHFHVDAVLPGRPEWVGLAVPEKESAYPEARMFGMLPVSGLYVRHARDLVFGDLVFTAPPGEPRPTVILDDVNGARIAGLKSTPVAGGRPVLELVGSKNVKVVDSTQAPSTPAF